MGCPEDFCEPGFGCYRARNGGPDCADPEPLPLGEQIAGDTRLFEPPGEGDDEEPASCNGGGGTGTDQVFVFDAPTHGVLYVEFDTASGDWGGRISARRGCDDPLTEVSCGHHTIQAICVPPGPAYLLIDGFTDEGHPSDEGEWFMTADFTGCAADQECRNSWCE